MDDGGYPQQTDSRPLPSAWCEECGSETRPWVLEVVRGRSVCPACAAKHGAAKTRSIITWMVVAAVVVAGSVGVASYLLGRIPKEGTPQHALYVLEKALERGDVATVDALMDRDSMTKDAVPVQKAYEYPLGTLQQLYDDVIGPGVTYATVCQEGDRMILVAEVPKNRGDGPGTYTVYYTMDRAAEGAPAAWRVTHVNNLDQVAVAFHTDIHGTPPKAAVKATPAKSS